MPAGLARGGQWRRLPTVPAYTQTHGFWSLLSSSQIQLNRLLPLLFAFNPTQVPGVRQGARLRVDVHLGLPAPGGECRLRAGVLSCRVLTFSLLRADLFPCCG